jgi:hypothetical protein
MIELTQEMIEDVCGAAPREGVSLALRTQAGPLGVLVRGTERPPEPDACDLSLATLDDGTRLLAAHTELGAVFLSLLADGAL